MTSLLNTVLWQAQNFGTSTVLIFLVVAAVDRLLLLRMVGLEAVERRGVVASVSDKAYRLHIRCAYFHNEAGGSVFLEKFVSPALPWRQR
jgi:hypothetical protein